jgi:dihydroorotase
MRLTIRRPDDFHVHFRTGATLKTVVPYTAQWFKRALVMPNTVPPILTGADCRRYKEEILAAAKDTAPDFEPLMSIKLTQRTTPGNIRAAYQAGAIIGKAYPAGVTTNAEDGIQDFDAMAPVFSAMEEIGMVLSKHGELPSAPCLSREVSFLPILCKLVEEFPNLRIVLEHLSTRKAVETVTCLPRTVAATITAHHLVLTIDDVIGGALNPHNFCKPIAQTADDRQALIDAATSGSSKFFFGSDSAPHLKCIKERAGGAGIFSAPVILPLLCQVFEEAEALGKLGDFTSKFGAQFYELPLNDGSITIVGSVPEEIGGIVPFMAGQKLSWHVKTK